MRPALRACVFWIVCWSCCRQCGPPTSAGAAAGGAGRHLLEGRRAGGRRLLEPRPALQPALLAGVCWSCGRRCGPALRPAGRQAGGAAAGATSCVDVCFEQMCMALNFSIVIFCTVNFFELLCHCAGCGQHRHWPQPAVNCRDLQGIGIGGDAAVTGSTKSACSPQFY